MDSKIQIVKQTNPDFKLIYSDILKKLHPEKTGDCIKLLSKKKLSVRDILELNEKIFGRSEKSNQKYRSYDRPFILHILEFQKSNHLNNIQLAKHFNVSRNSVAKWKKSYLIKI